MIGRKDMKQETMAKRVRNKAVSNKMMSPHKKMDMGMSPGPGMGADSAPMMPMGMKKGGKVDFSKIVRNTKTGKLSEKTYGSTEDVMGTGKTPAAAKAAYAKKMKGAGMEPRFAKGGMSEKGMMYGGMAETGMKHGGMAKKGMKSGGMMLIIGLGKKKGK
jgi:hypothetical protein